MISNMDKVGIKNHILEIFDDKIYFIGTCQSVPQWFTCRFFTLTASTAEKEIHNAMKNVTWIVLKNIDKMLKVY